MDVGRIIVSRYSLLVSCPSRYVDAKVSYKINTSTFSMRQDFFDYFARVIKEQCFD